MTGSKDLELRARTFATIRQFFAERRVLEVDTNALSTTTVTDPAIESIEATVGGDRHFLQTSPEFAMKRLLAGGSGDIYQLCRVFRDREVGRWHLPEFVLLEWYRVGFTEHDLMAETCDLLTRIFELQRDPPRFEKATYADTFVGATGLDPHREDPELEGELVQALHRAGIDVPPALDRASLLDLVFSTVVVPSLPTNRGTVLYDYPVAQCALAVIAPGSPPVARRFEVFAGGIELANGFFELDDATEQRHRFQRDLATRTERGQKQVPLDEPFLDALARLPACAGVAVGVDRVIALTAGDDGLKVTARAAEV
jgi:lysyl-tRNA synthetase class 2